MSASSECRLQRRKSAHGRLQSSSTVAADTKSHGEARASGGCEAKARSRRVKSARETKEASDVFPTAKSGSAWGSTQYGDDFGKKQPSTPVPVRPVSPTRRNNPHPSKPFLQWKHPVRVHTHKRAVHPPEEAWKYINECFYDDYTDTRNTGDAKNEVPVTNLAKIEFPGNKKSVTLSTPHLISGTKAQLNPRLHKGHPTQGEATTILRPPSPKSRMIHNTVRSSSLPLLQEWLKTASNKERNLVLQMLTAAHTDSEDARLKKAVSGVLRPDSARRVQKWLQSATVSERKTLLNVLETLAVASSGDHLTRSPPPHLVLPPANWRQGPDHHCRSYSYPVCLRPCVCHGHTKSHGGGHYSHHHHYHCHKHHTHTHTPSHHHHKAHCHKAHQSSTHESKRINGEDMTLFGKKMGVEYQKVPELWHHKVPPAKEELLVIHPGAVFGQPHRDRGRHYAIHPEWPTA